MHTAEELEVLRVAYRDALMRYDAVAETLSRQFIAGARPSAEELELEHYARLALDAARERFLDAWKRS